MFDSILGLPAHPLIVHGAVVLVPLAALAGVLAVGWSAVRDKAALVALVVTSIAGVLVIAAGASGEKLEEQVTETALVETHAEMGETLLPVVAGLWLGLAVMVVLARYTARDRDAAGRTAIRLAGVVAMVVVVFTAIGSTVQVARIGHSGAKAVWNDVGAGKVAPAEKGEDGE